MKFTKIEKSLLALPTLYKKTSTGAIQFWEMRVQHYSKDESYLCTRYGQVDTASPQETTDPITKGKNVGRANETSVAQQAEAEALAKWEKQKKKGYVETKIDAFFEKTDAVIEGGIVPMLAHKFTDHGHKIKYPAYAQPKLDGIRSIATVKPDVTLWSRTRKPITSMPHIIEEVRKVFGILHDNPDGELYNHEFKNDFEKIVSAVRKETPEDGYLNVQYHIYDLAGPGTFAERVERLYNKMHCYEKAVAPLEYLRFVPTKIVNNEEELMEAFIRFRNLGYEGVMVRNADGKYVNKRSYDLLKVKEFDDAEFEITGIDEGRGKLTGHVGAFVCRTKDGKEFLAKMSGDTGMLKKYFENHKLWKGKQLTVKYQGLTGANGVPRFPVGVTIRDYE